jgi:hypothetical protein
MSFSLALSRHALLMERTYLPYVFDGDAWTEEQKQQIIATLLLYVPERVYPDFVTWHFFQTEPDLFLVMRAGYEQGSYYPNLSGALGEIRGHYERFSCN